MKTYPENLQEAMHTTVSFDLPTDYFQLSVSDRLALLLPTIILKVREAAQKNGVTPIEGLMTLAVQATAMEGMICGQFPQGVEAYYRAMCDCLPCKIRLTIIEYHICHMPSFPDTLEWPFTQEQMRAAFNEVMENTTLAELETGYERAVLASRAMAAMAHTPLGKGNWN